MSELLRGKAFPRAALELCLCSPAPADAPSAPHRAPFWLCHCFVTRAGGGRRSSAHTRMCESARGPQAQPHHSPAEAGGAPPVSQPRPPVPPGPLRPAPPPQPQGPDRGRLQRPCPPPLLTAGAAREGTFSSFSRSPALRFMAPPQPAGLLPPAALPHGGLQLPARTAAGSREAPPTL